MPKRVAIGVVSSDKMSKTRVVKISWSVKHPRYKKYLRRQTTCYVHDEKNESGLGDKVEIRESQPRSTKKRWELVRVVEKSRAVDVAALRAKGTDESLAAEIELPGKEKNEETPQES
jgi:small subunit ribosomal protein S17